MPAKAERHASARKQLFIGFSCDCRDGNPSLMAYRARAAGVTPASPSQASAIRGRRCMRDCARGIRQRGTKPARPRKTLTPTGDGSPLLGALKSSFACHAHDKAILHGAASCSVAIPQTIVAAIDRELCGALQLAILGRVRQFLDCIKMNCRHASAWRIRHDETSSTSRFQLPFALAFCA